MSVLNQRVERDFKSVVQAQMVLADTLNQPVRGSSPLRLTSEIAMAKLTWLHNEHMAGELDISQGFLHLAQTQLDI